MSSRDGTVVFLNDLLAEAKARALEIVREKNDHKVLDLQYDSVLFYMWRTERYMSREVLGVERGETDFLV